jgi:hypothetical protein
MSELRSANCARARRHVQTCCRQSDPRSPENAGYPPVPFFRQAPVFQLSTDGLQTLPSSRTSWFARVCQRKAGRQCRREPGPLKNNVVQQALTATLRAGASGIRVGQRAGSRLNGGAAGVAQDSRPECGIVSSTRGWLAHDRRRRFNQVFILLMACSVVYWLPVERKTNDPVSG